MAHRSTSAAPGSSPTGNTPDDRASNEPDAPRVRAAGLFAGSSLRDAAGGLAQWGLLALVVVQQGLHFQTFGTFHADHAIQIAAARSLVAGTGLSVAEVDLADLSQPQRGPLVARLPAYAYVLAAALVVTGELWSAVALLGWVLAAGFTLVWWEIVRRAGPAVSPRARWLLLAYWGLVFVPTLDLSTEELLALVLYSASLAAVLIALDQATGSSAPAAADRPGASHDGSAARTSTSSPGPARTLIWSVVAGISLAAVAWTRMAYWLLLPVVPLAMWFAAGAKPAVRRAAVLVLSLACAGAAIQSLHQYITTGQFAYVWPEPPGPLRWTQLGEIYPFPAAALGLDRFAVLAGQANDAPSGWMWGLLWLLSLPVLAALLWWARQAIRGAPAADDFDSARDLAATPHAAHCGRMLAWTACGTTAATLATLAVMSLRYRAPEGWLWIAQPRFYGPVYPFLALSVLAVVGWHAVQRAAPADSNRGAAPVRRGAAPVRRGAIPARGVTAFAALRGVLIGLLVVGAVWIAPLRLIGWQRASERRLTDPTSPAATRADVDVLLAAQAEFPTAAPTVVYAAGDQRSGALARILDWGCVSLSRLAEFSPDASATASALSEEHASIADDRQRAPRAVHPRAIAGPSLLLIALSDDSPPAARAEVETLLSQLAARPAGRLTRADLFAALIAPSHGEDSSHSEGNNEGSNHREGSGNSEDSSNCESSSNSRNHTTGDNGPNGRSHGNNRGAVGVMAFRR